MPDRYTDSYRLDVKSDRSKFSNLLNELASAYQRISNGLEAAYDSTGTQKAKESNAKEQEEEAGEKRSTPIYHHCIKTKEYCPFCSSRVRPAHYDLEYRCSHCAASWSCQKNMEWYTPDV